MIEVDARGHRCPIPTLRLRRALARAAPGETVALMCDDPLARVDVPHFVRERGLELVSEAAAGVAWRFVVRTPSSPPALGGGGDAEGGGGSTSATVVTPP